MSKIKNISNYRATFILDVRGYQEPVKTLINKLKDTIIAIQGKVIRLKDLGQKAFIRVTDRKFMVGYYVQIYFTSPETVPQMLKEKLRLERTVHRIFIQSAA